MAERRETRPVMVGGVAIGGGAPIAVQSMTNTDTRDAAATLAQIGRLADAGCEIVRVAIPRADALDGFAEIVRGARRSRSSPTSTSTTASPSRRPGAARRSCASIPATSARGDRVDAVIDAAGEAGIPIRIGVNAGSLAERVPRPRLAARREARRERGRVLPALRVAAASRTSSSRRRRPRVPARSTPTGCSPTSCRTRCTSASPRRAPRCPAP